MTIPVPNVEIVFEEIVLLLEPEESMIPMLLPPEPVKIVFEARVLFKLPLEEMP